MARTSAQTPKNETTKTQTQGAGFRLPVKPAAVAVCALLDGGCTAPAAQVRPEPPAISCPEGWQETHERLHIKSRGLATLKGYKHEPGEVARVKDGPATLRVESVPGLPENTLLLGRLQLGADRLFGTFTQAQIPGAGTVPVCLVVGLDTDAGFVDERGKNYDCGPGLGVCLDPGSEPGNAKVYPRFSLHWPTEF